MDCGVWCLECRVWCLECGVWCMECTVWCGVCGVRFMVREVRPVTSCRFSIASKWPIWKMTRKFNLPRMVGKFVCFIDCLVSKHLV